MLGDLHSLSSTGGQNTTRLYVQCTSSALCNVVVERVAYDVMTKAEMALVVLDQAGASCRVEMLEKLGVTRRD